MADCGRLRLGFLDIVLASLPANPYKINPHRVEYVLFTREFSWLQDARSGLGPAFFPTGDRQVPEADDAHGSMTARRALCDRQRLPWPPRRFGGLMRRSASHPMSRTKGAVLATMQLA
jgi:hypothetical protein